MERRRRTAAGQHGPSRGSLGPGSPLAPKDYITGELHCPQNLATSVTNPWNFLNSPILSLKLGANLDAWMTVRTGAAHVEEVWRATWSWEHNPSQEFHTILGEGATL